MEGLFYLEIAETTGTAIGTVMSRLSRGRAELRRTWELSLHRHAQTAVEARPRARRALGDAAFLARARPAAKP
jgi:hypothetical protein